MGIEVVGTEGALELLPRGVRNRLGIDLDRLQESDLSFLPIS